MDNLWQELPEEDDDDGEGVGADEAQQHQAVTQANRGPI